MKTEILTVRQIRRLLFKTEKYAVIGDTEMTNREARTHLMQDFMQEDQLNVIDNGDHLLIW